MANLSERPRYAQLALLLVASLLWAAIFAALLSSALVLRYGSLRDTGLLPIRVYETLFTVHGAFAVSFVNATQLLALAIVVPLQPRELVRPIVHFGTIASVGLQAASLAAISIRPLPVWVGNAVALVPSTFVAISLIVALVHWRSRSMARWGIVVLVGSALAAVAWPSARDELSFLLCVLALSRGRLAAVTSGVLAISALATLRGTGAWGFALSLVWFCGAVWLVVSTWKASSQLEPPSARWAARSGLILFATGLLLRLFLSASSVDVHLWDTLFVVAAYHARLLGLTLLVVALILRELAQAASVEAPIRWAGLGVISCLLGSLGFVLLCAHLGALGMPRRYVTYLPDFTRLQVAISLSVLILAGGAITLAFEVVRACLSRMAADRRRPPRGETISGEFRP